MYKFKINIDKNEYNKFIFENNASFMQEINWAKVKNNWKNLICGVYEQNKLVAACSILIKNLFRKITLFYIPRGYVIDFENIDLLKFMTDNIKNLAKQKNAYLVKIDPYFCVNEYFWKDNSKHLNYFSKNAKNKHDNLIKLGYKHTGFHKELHSNFQPRFNMAIPLVSVNKEHLTYDEFLKTLKSKFRYYLGDYHKKRGVFFTHSYDKKDIHEFVRLLQYTEKNKKISLRNEEYFNRIINNFSNRTCLLFGKVNLKIYLEFLKNNNGKKEEIEQLKELIKDRGEIITLSSALLLLPKTKDFKCSEYLYAGNDLLLKKLNVSGGIALEAAKISIEHNCEYCNLGGVEGTLDDSLSNFKSKYNAVVLEFVGEYDLIINKKLYFFINKFKPILKNIYNIIKNKNL